MASLTSRKKSNSYYDLLMLQSGSTCCSDGTLTSLSSKTLGWSSLFPLASTLNGEYDLTSSLNS